MTTLNPSDDILFPIDAEHGGLRLVVLGVFFATWIAVFVLVSAVMNTDGPNFIALFGGFLAAYGTTFLAERTLKQVWTSGRALRVSRLGVALLLRDETQSSILAEDPVVPVFYRFTVQKRARIPKGWSVMACALEGEDATVCVYTFMPPATVEAYPRLDLFKKLMPKKRPTLDDDGREDLRLAGEQRRLREAEEKRYLAGAEMTIEDFTAFIELLHHRFPEWTLSPNASR